MKTFFLEYIWLDGNYPQQLRSKTKIVEAKNEDKIKLSNWNFDGSSTNQADTQKSELILRPVNRFKNPFLENSILVLCEVWTPEGERHQSNTRALLSDTVKQFDQDTLYGFEQEFIIYDTKTQKPVGWPKQGFPRPQGDYYCGVGSNNVSGREFIEELALLCLQAGLKISGTNAEVMLGQWEYQIGPVAALDGSDQLWISRWIMNRLSEKYHYRIELDPKPYPGNEWNGSGMHVNFSTQTMRQDIDNKYSLAVEACHRLSDNIEDHIKVYGKNNHHRLTGANETCSIDNFRWGVGDRTASIRLPYSIKDKETAGYIEDRRPASNADPYEVCNVLITTICVEKS